ncbi:hypothetical protein HPB49_010842 [Dermacentor silvarum]|uniref:Uncharacterized protein n=1 Tax=Dermacentor silvarum TaxID=543639 RepID=A0ACB8C335_DERSI|nr:hypothetical protein HPB49_010842 [Dermacentor silvarum]
MSQNLPQQIPGTGQSPESTAGLERKLLVSEVTWRALSIPQVAIPKTTRSCPGLEKLQAAFRFQLQDLEPWSFRKCRRGSKGDAQVTQQAHAHIRRLTGENATLKAERTNNGKREEQPAHSHFKSDTAMSNREARYTAGGHTRPICHYPEVGGFNAAHPLWGYTYTNPRGNLLHKVIGDKNLTLVDDPRNRTRLDTSVARYTNPDLTLTRNIPQACWANLEEYLCSVHALLSTTLHGLE